MPTIDEFLEHLIALPAPDDAERLYDDSSTRGELRLSNLRRYLELLAGADTALVGEAPGWRGMTVTGVPFMSVRELGAGLITGSADGDGFGPPPAPTAQWEASSRVVWSALEGWRGSLPVSWPIYPHHPFLPPDRLTNRTPRPAEVAAGAPLAAELLEALSITRVIAVGRKAEAALKAAGIEAIAVRHPAQGGAVLFTEQLRALAG